MTAATTYPVEIDIDRRDVDLDAEPLACLPTQWRRTPNGIHLRYDVTGWPDWCDPESDDRTTRERSTELLSLFRYAMAANVPGFDPAAPVQGLRSHGRGYQRYEAQRDKVLSLESCLARVAGSRIMAEPATDEEIRAAGYEPGGRYTRERCPFGDDHVSGGQGKGHCVIAMDHGIKCFGKHATTGGERFISWSALRGDTTHSADLLVTWASRREDLAAMASFYGHRAGTIAAARLRYLCRDPEPRPLAKRNPFRLVWSVDAACVGQYFPHSHYLDTTVDPTTRIHDVVAQYPSFWTYDATKAEWVPINVAARGLLAKDSSRWIEFGVTPARTAPVTDVYSDATGWTWDDHGMPLLTLTPERPPSEKRADREVAAKRLREFLSEMPIPVGMDAQHADALRLAWLLPGLTETYPGQQPLVMLAGGTGVGKGRTVDLIQQFWRHHYAGAILKGEEKELDNALLDGSRGAIFRLDELGVGESSAQGAGILARLKSVLTTKRHRVRLYHSQKFVTLLMAHCWFAMGRSFAGLSAELENDWARRTVPIQLPQAVPNAAQYSLDLEDFVRSYDCLEVAQWLRTLWEGRDQIADRKAWAAIWPDAMPAWQAIVGIAAEELGIRLDAAEFRELLPRDRGALELVEEWWLQAKKADYLVDSKHSLRTIADFADSRSSFQQYRSSSVLAAALVSQGASNDGNVRLEVDGYEFTFYAKDSCRWKVKRKVSSNGSKKGSDAPATPSSSTERWSPTISVRPTTPALPAETPSPRVPSTTPSSSDSTWTPKLTAIPTPNPSSPPRPESVSDATGRFAPKLTALPSAASDASATPASTPSSTTRTNDEVEAWVPKLSVAPGAKAIGSSLSALTASDDGGANTASASSPAPLRSVSDAANPSAKDPLSPSLSLPAGASATSVLPRFVAADFESWHRTDGLLKKAGAYKYWRTGAEATALVSCIVQDGSIESVQVWTPEPIREIEMPPHCVEMIGDAPVAYFHGPDCPAPLLAEVEAGTVFAAHNVQFDARAWTIGMSWPAPAAWVDTMHFARGLHKVGGLDDLLSRLFTHGKTDKPERFLPWNGMSPIVRQRLVRYCAADAIPTAMALVRMLPYLHREHILGSIADFAKNNRGLGVDLPLARGLVRLRDAIVSDAVAALREKDDRLTLKFIGSKKVVEWLQEHGLTIHKRTAKGAVSMEGDVLEAIYNNEDTDDYSWSDEVPEEKRALALEVVYVRLCNAGISAGKAGTAIAFADGSRLRDTIQYAGTHTWRAAGRRIQPQNFARGSLPKGCPREAIDELMGLVRELGEEEGP